MNFKKNKKRINKSGHSKEFRNFLENNNSQTLKNQPYNNENSINFYIEILRKLELLKFTVNFSLYFSGKNKNNLDS